MWFRCARGVIAAAVLFTASPAAGQQAYPVEPLRLDDVLSLAGQRRAEIAAAQARVRAAEARPAIAGALEDPMVSASVDHLPFMFDGADVSFTIEQRFPLSKIRDHRRDAALADVDRFRADAARTNLDVRYEAATAFLMLHERRRMAAIVDAQLAAARDVVTAANARYAAATATQSDVLLAEVEVARLSAGAAGFAADIRAAEEMLNAALAFPPGTPVPALDAVSVSGGLETSRAPRPELDAARAAIRRAGAEVAVMKDMFKPMAVVRAGPAYTMAEGNGVMFMVGVSVPLWRGALRAGVAEAEAMRDMARADLDAMTRMIDGEMAAARLALDAARVRLVATRDDLVPRARAAIGPAVSSYAAGQVPLTSVIAAVQALWQAEGELVNVELQHGLAMLKLRRASAQLEGARQ